MVMAEHDSLESRITSRLPQISNSQRKLARFILGNGLFVAFASATELGEKADVSAATVVRFCQTLGYAGYSDLQAAMRASLPTYLHKVQQFEKGKGLLNKNQAIAQAFDLDIQNLRRTVESLDLNRFTSAVNALAKASDILVVAGGVSSAPALYLAHSLKVMGLDARAVLNGGIPLALELTQLKRTSALVGISVWRYVAETTAAMERAQSVHATRLAITDSLVSPLSQRADYAFQIATDGAAHALSLTSMMTLINAFIAALSFARPKETARALREVDIAYREGKLLME